MAWGFVKVMLSCAAGSYLSAGTVCVTTPNIEPYDPMYFDSGCAAVELPKIDRNFYYQCLVGHLLLGRFRFYLSNYLFQFE